MISVYTKSIDVKKNNGKLRLIFNIGVYALTSVGEEGI